MQAERVLLKTDEQGRLIDLPKLPPNTRLEAIFLLLEEPMTLHSKRMPPSNLKGSVTTSSGPFDPILSDAEWDASLDRTARQVAGDPEAFA